MKLTHIFEAGTGFRVLDTTERSQTGLLTQMINDHSKAGEKLKKLAQQKKVTLPPQIMPKAKQTKERLAKLNGADFDREYVKTMVAMHEKDVAAFEAFAKSATDADVKAFAAATLPTLEHHLEMIRTLAKSMAAPAK